MLASFMTTSKAPFSRLDSVHHVSPLRPYAHADLAFRKRFEKLLNKAGISSPNITILDNIEIMCPARLLACSRATMAHHLYKVWQ